MSKYLGYGREGGQMDLFTILDKMVWSYGVKIFKVCLGGILNSVQCFLAFVISHSIPHSFFQSISIDVVFYLKKKTYAVSTHCKGLSEVLHNPCLAEPGYTLPLQTI